MKSEAKRSLSWLKEWPQGVQARQAYVDPIFSTIAAKYDFMTKALSFGQEPRWKSRAVKLLLADGVPENLLDLACGTGDFPFYFRQAGLQSQVVGLDRNPTMLKVSRKKCPPDQKLHFLQGDLMQIPFKDSSFDAITMGYGLRYVADIRRSLEEVFRLLRSSGRFVCLDFGVPPNSLYRKLCFGYLFLFGSAWGLVLHGKADTYWHIVESLKAYPGQETVGRWLCETGFTDVEKKNQLGGIACIHSAVRP